MPQADRPRQEFHLQPLGYQPSALRYFIDAPLSYLITTTMTDRFAVAITPIHDERRVVKQDNENPDCRLVVVMTPHVRPSTGNPA